MCVPAYSRWSKVPLPIPRFTGKLLLPFRVKKGKKKMENLEKEGKLKVKVEFSLSFKLFTFRNHCTETCLGSIKRSF